MPDSNPLLYRLRRHSITVEHSLGKPLALLHRGQHQLLGPLLLCLQDPLGSGSGGLGARLGLHHQRLVFRRGLLKPLLGLGSRLGSGCLHKLYGQ